MQGALELMLEESWEKSSRTRKWPKLRVPSHFNGRGKADAVDRGQGLLSYQLSFLFHEVMELLLGLGFMIPLTMYVNYVYSLSHNFPVKPMNNLQFPPKYRYLTSVKYRCSNLERYPERTTEH